MRILKAIVALLVATIAGVFVLVSYSSVESRLECSGHVALDATKKPMLIYLRLEQYRWWVVWGDSDGSLWAEIPKRSVEYFGKVQRLGDQLHVFRDGTLAGSFSTLSKTLALTTTEGFFDATCKPVQ